jgi:guanylate kinase
MSSETPLLFIVSSPSGAGKTTLTRRFLERVPKSRFSVSHTTRKPRNGEQDGREYFFVSRETFEKLTELDEFLEWAEVHGNLYGTSRKEAQRRDQTDVILFDIDHQGARQIKCAHDDAVTVFILPPSWEILERRLRGRASDDEETTHRRLRGARREIEHYGLFDYVIVNDDLDEATTTLLAIYRAELARRERAAHLAERLLRIRHGQER